jgi:hypothetical protein
MRRRQPFPHLSIIREPLVGEVELIEENCARLPKAHDEPPQRRKDTPNPRAKLSRAYGAERAVNANVFGGARTLSCYDGKPSNNVANKC